MPHLDQAVPRFRGTVGLLAFAYFARLALEVPRFSSNDGLLEHRLVESVYPFLWQPLFGHQTPDLVMVGIYLFACLVSLAMVAGKRPRLCALLLYIVAVCAYRWNFQIVSVDDGLMHLFLFWLVILPERETFRCVRLLLMNLSLIYLVAGLSKWTSPMWRDGVALTAVVQLPGSWFPGLSQYQGLLALLTWGVLVLEPTFAILPWLGDGTPKRLLVAIWVAFHLSIALIMDVALANLLCLSTGWLLFADKPAPAPYRKSERFAALMLGVLACATLSSLVQNPWREPGKPMTGHHLSEAGTGPQLWLNAALWSVGLAQQYRLLDWIDQRNFKVELEGGPEILSLREGLVLSYATEATWLPLPGPQRALLREKTRERWTRFYGDFRVRWQRVE